MFEKKNIRVINRKREKERERSYQTSSNGSRRDMMLLGLKYVHGPSFILGRFSGLVDEKSDPISQCQKDTKSLFPLVRNRCF